MPTSSDVLLQMYGTAVLIAEIDEQIRTAIRRGRLAQFYFPVRGQEAISAAMGAAVRRDDYLVTTYRGMHDEIAKGVDLVPLLAEVLGRDGLAHGKGGPMHICDLDAGMMLSSGIVGSTVPMANGLALASQVKGEDRVTVCMLGDGATNTGAFHEGMNLAAVWDLPVVFICQNNQWAETTRTDETYRCESLTARAAAYGIPAESVDGYDAAAVYEALVPALERARAGRGPTFLDCACFRFFGHYFGDAMERVPPELLEQERQNDPVERLRASLQAAGVDAATIDAKTAAQQEAAQRAFDEAFACAAPDPAVALVGTYADPIEVR